MWYQPDLLFVSNERAHILFNGANVRGAPDLVIEILSPSTTGRDRSLKRALYARYGVSEYWLVNPDARTVTVLRLDDGAFAEVAHYGAGANPDFTHPARLRRQPGCNLLGGRRTAMVTAPLDLKRTYADYCRTRR